MSSRGHLSLAILCLSGCFVDAPPTLTGASETSGMGGATSEGEPTGGTQCGDEVVQAGEQCDIGPQGNGACTDKCQLNVCGDGYVGAGESCDGTPGCVGCKSVTCGDGKIDPGEQCDDGNSTPTDGCTDLCKNAACGDGVVQIAFEECDDGNDVPTDACTPECKSAKCGDGFVGPGETCDDGNMVDNDGCTNSCATPGCGDGIVSGGEECDDGNLEVTDACLPTCKAAKCGDGVVWAGMEACDDSNASDADGCLTSCQPNVCGDGILNPLAEECDHGPWNHDDPDTAACSQTCTRSAFLVFVTSEVFTPGQTFTGIAEADMLCSQAATSDIGALKIRGSRWKAWLGTTMGGPDVTFYQSPLPYVKLGLNGVDVVAFNWSDLTDGNLQSPINHSESVTPLPSGPSCTLATAVWTGFEAGKGIGSHCDDWTSNLDVKATIGNFTSTGGGWSSTGCQYPFYCSKQARLYCFEQPPQ